MNLSHRSFDVILIELDDGVIFLLYISTFYLPWPSDFSCNAMMWSATLGFCWNFGIKYEVQVNEINVSWRSFCLVEWSEFIKIFEIKVEKMRIFTKGRYLAHSSLLFTGKNALFFNFDLENDKFWSFQLGCIDLNCIFNSKISIKSECCTSHHRILPTSINYFKVATVACN